MRPLYKIGLKLCACAYLLYYRLSPIPISDFLHSQIGWWNFLQNKDNQPSEIRESPMIKVKKS